MRTQDELTRRAALAIAARLPEERPEVFLTLGSGLSDVADAMEDTVDVPVAAVPGVPVSRVPGHAGVLRFGHLGGRRVLAQVGRIHLYEGHEARDVTRMVEVAAELGATTYVVTNAAGGLNTDFTPGDVMLITDHLNLTGDSPLTGVLRDGAPVFLDMAAAYDADLREAARRVAADQGLALREGVYAGLRGPTFETPAEVSMLRTLGADAVGMSTVLEVIAARAAGMRVLGVSSITNVHGEGVETSHEEVLEVGKRIAAAVSQLVVGVVSAM